MNMRCQLLFHVFLFVLLAGRCLGQTTLPQQPHVTGTFDISPKDLARFTWDANALHSVSRRKAYEDFLLLGYAVQVYKQNPNADPNATLTFLNNVSDYYTRRRNEASNGYKVPE